MRILLCCALALCACGSPLDAFVGTYSIVGASSKLSINGGAPMTQSLGLTDTKLIIIHDVSSSGASNDVLSVSLGGVDFAKASLASDGTVQTLVGSDHVVDSSGCDYFTAWDKGTLALDGSVLTMKRLGNVRRVCTASMGQSLTGTGDETIQATKDR